jgi:hypothetical protein|tara:strand:- start:2382 stop:3128 length:747 start_codon:yes stop_codon:yes gene_type:complete
VSITPGLTRIDFVLNQHLWHAWSRAHKEGVDPHLAVAREQRVFETIRSCDPTPACRYHAWLSAWRRRQWLCAGLRSVPDISELADLTAALERFQTFAPRLPVEHRDINRYSDAQELIDAEQHLAPPADRDRHEQEKAQAKADSRVLYADGPWRLIRLETVAAAQWWGRGTRWCTAARVNNAFCVYAAQGPLIVVLTPSGRYQLATASMEFRDAGDRPASLAAVLEPAPEPLGHALWQLIKLHAHRDQT